MIVRATRHRRGAAGPLRPPQQPPRRAVGVGIGLAALVLLALGVALGRASAPNPQPHAAPTSAGPGPWRLIHGVPIGYAHSEAGAVAAAGNYTAVLGDKANVDPAFGAEAYPLFALSDVREDLQRRSREFAARVEDASALAVDQGFALRGVPVGYRVEQYRKNEATVSVWYVATGVGTAQLPMATSWGTDRLTLRWVEGDWKIAAIVGQSGPTPPAGAADPGDRDLALRINGFEPFAYQPRSSP